MRGYGQHGYILRKPNLFLKKKKKSRSDSQQVQSSQMFMHQALQGGAENRFPSQVCLQPTFSYFSFHLVLYASPLFNG